MLRILYQQVDVAMRSALRQACHLVAFGPVMPGWGSWEWVGRDLAGELARYFDTGTWEAHDLPACDVLVIVKHLPPPRWVAAAARHARLVYAPVDYYGAAADIDADGAVLRHCAHIVVHCEELRPYFAPYAPVTYLDHHVKFTAPPCARDARRDEVLWVGVRTNLPPLVDWVNHHPLPLPLRVLSNLEEPADVDPRRLGFAAHVNVTVEEWTAERQRSCTATARAALDIKGDDFRARHKPPAKPIDFLASGVPLAMNPGCSAVAHLAQLGFEVAAPLDVERWLSRDYAVDTCRLGLALRELLSLERIGRRWRRLLKDVIAGR